MSNILKFLKHGAKRKKTINVRRYNIYKIYSKYVHHISSTTICINKYETSKQTNSFNYLLILRNANCPFEHWAALIPESATHKPNYTRHPTISF